MSTVARIQVVQCDACGEKYPDRIPQVSAGDEGWSVCSMCRTVEGDWTIYENCDCNDCADSGDPLEETGDANCPKCKGKGWVEI